MVLEIDPEEVQHPLLFFPPSGGPMGGNRRGEEFLRAYGWQWGPPRAGNLSIGGRHFLSVQLMSRPDGDVFILLDAHCAPNRDLLISQISHEIRNPLNNIIGMSEMCLSAAAESPNRRWLECIKEASSHLLRIANDLLDLSDARDQVELKLHPYDLRKLMANTVRFVAPMAEAKGILLITKVLSSVPELLRGDQDRIRQILLNLLTNAIKFSEAGTVSVESKVEEGLLLISVADTGRGIPKDQLDKVFLPFYQASPEDRGHGRGLGLAICMKLAESMGGTIEARSNPGKGSTFTLKVPAVPAEDAQLHLDSPDITKANTPPLRILLAEDDPLNRELVEAALTSMGHSVRAASNGEEALRIFRSEAFDLAILDVNMPRGDGVWLAREIRTLEAKDPSRKRTPLLALTACASEEDRKRCLNAGMDVFLSKPVPLDQLREAVDAAAKGEAPAIPDEMEDSQVNTNQLLDMSMGDQEVASKALTIFREGVPLMLETLRMLIHRRDLDGAASVAHKLKGRFATLGNLAAADYLAKLEEKLRSGQEDDPEAISIRVIQFTRQTLKAYQRINIRPE